MILLFYAGAVVNGTLGPNYETRFRKQMKKFQRFGISMLERWLAALFGSTYEIRFHAEVVVNGTLEPKLRDPPQSSRFSINR